MTVPWDRARLPVALCAGPAAGLGVARLLLQPPQGDEPHYLVISESLWRYGSLAVMRVYQGGDYAAFYPLPLDPHVAPGPDGALLPLHAIGGPLLWLLPYGLAGRAGVVAFMTAVALLIVATVHRLVRELGLPGRTATGVAVAFGLGTPLLAYAGMAFVEPLGALGVLVALRVLHQREPRAPDVALASAALWVLPWVHGRFLLFPPLFTAFLAVRVWREPRLRAALALPAAVLIGALVVYDVTVWHTLSPVQNQVSGDATPFRVAPWHGLSGLVLDQEVGLVPHAPLVLFVLPGLVLAARRALTVHVLAAAVPYLLVVSSFPAWDGAWSPPVRFASVVLPLFAGHVALAVHRARAGIALAATAVVGGVLAAVDVLTPTGGFSAQTGVSPSLAWLDDHLGTGLAGLVPSSPLPGQGLLFTVWAAGVLAAAAIVLARARRGPETETRDRVSAGTSPAASAG